MCNLGRDDDHLSWCVSSLSGEAFQSKSSRIDGLRVDTGTVRRIFGGVTKLSVSDQSGLSAHILEAGSARAGMILVSPSSFNALSSRSKPSIPGGSLRSTGRTGLRLQDDFLPGSVGRVCASKMHSVHWWGRESVHYTGMSVCAKGSVERH